MTSLIPMLYSSWWENLNEPHSIMDQHFGLGLRPEQLPISSNDPWLSSYRLHGRHFPSSTIYYRPWSAFLRCNGDAHGAGGSSVVKADKNQFKVVLDVQQFKPEEINVKVINKCVVVVGKHEEKRDDHGWISRQFERRYLIPNQCNVDEITSSLSSDGVLTLTAPLKEQEIIKDEKPIEIEHTGKLAAVENVTSQYQSPGEGAEKMKEKADAK